MIHGNKTINISFNSQGKCSGNNYPPRFIDQLEHWGVGAEAIVYKPYDNDTKELFRLYKINPTVRDELKKYSDIIVAQDKAFKNFVDKYPTLSFVDKEMIFLKELTKLNNNDTKINGHFWGECDGDIADPDFKEYKCIKLIQRLTDDQCFQHLPEFQDEMIEAYIAPIYKSMEKANMSKSEFIEMIRRASDGRMYEMSNCNVNAVVNKFMLEEMADIIECPKPIEIKYGNMGWLRKDGTKYYEFEDERSINPDLVADTVLFNNCLGFMRKIFEKKERGLTLSMAETQALEDIGIDPNGVEDYRPTKTYGVGGRYKGKKNTRGVAVDKNTGICKNINMSQLEEFNRKEKMVEHLRALRRAKDIRLAMME